MRDRRAAWAALAGVAAYNVVQNRWFTHRGYVPANLAVTAGLLALTRRAGVSWDELGIAPERLRSGLRLGVAAGAGAALAVAGGATHPRTLPLLEDPRVTPEGPLRTVFLVAVRFPVGTALYEEAAFRGVLPALWRRVSPRWGGLVPAVAFGLWHILPTWQTTYHHPASRRSATRRVGGTVAGVIATGVAGLGLQALGDRSRSLAAPWLAHAALNSAAYLAARMSSASGGE